MDKRTDEDEDDFGQAEAALADEPTQEDIVAEGNEAL